MKEKTEELLLRGTILCQESAERGVKCILRNRNERCAVCVCLGQRSGGSCSSAFGLGGVECHGGVRNPWISTKTSAPRCVEPRRLLAYFRANRLLRSQKVSGVVTSQLYRLEGDRIKRLCEWEATSQ
jgi:hypothetical protein